MDTTESIHPKGIVSFCLAWGFIPAHRIKNRYKIKALVCLGAWAILLLRVKDGVTVLIPPKKIMKKIVLAFALFSSASALAQNPSVQPTTQAASQPALPPPEVVAPTEPLVGWTPGSFDEPTSEPVVEEENTSFSPPEIPRPASQIGNALFAAAGIGFISASSGALIGLFSAARPNDVGAGREEMALGWELGSAAGAGLGVALSARSHSRPGSTLGAFVGSTLATAIAVGVAFPATKIVSVGIDDAPNTIPFFFAVPFVASIGGSILGYEFFPRHK
jgi:hypothetical protein